MKPMSRRIKSKELDMISYLVCVIEQKQIIGLKYTISQVYLWLEDSCQRKDFYVVVLPVQLFMVVSPGHNHKI